MARLEEFDDVQLDVEFTQAGTRSNLTSKENIAISFGKIAKWYEALVPTGGSSGQFLGFNSSGTAKWVSNPNVDEKVKAIKLAQSIADASYYPTLVAGEGTAGVNIFDSAKINHTKGTTSAVGNTRLILGNATNEGTTNNEEGLLRIYSPGTKYHTLKGAKITSDNVEHTLPTTGGTILNTGTTSFTQILSSGTKIGTIKINGTSSDIYAPTDTDTKVTDTVGTANTYYPAGGTSTSTATGTQVFDTSLKFIGTTGSTSAVGKAQLVLGNATASGTANNKQGSIVVYGSTAYAHTIQGAPTAARTLTLPDKTGTFALTSDIPSVPTVNDAALTLKGAGTTVTTFTANASSAKSLDIVAGSNVTVTADATNAKISIASSHPTITKSTDTTSTASPAHGGTFTVVDSITREANGHVTKINTKTVTLPADSNTDTKVTQTNTTTSADYRVLLSGNANDTTETTTGRKSAKLTFNPSSGGLYSFGFLWTDITGQTLDINTLTLSDGTLHSRRFIEKTDGGAFNITNIPVTGHPFLLEVDLIRWGSTTDYITRQRFTNAANGAYSYVRYCTNGTWGSWTTRRYTDTDTKVTSSANHYTPATASGQDKSASASGATAAWSIDVVKGVTLNTDGKGHVTGLSVTSGKIPANPVPSNNVTGSGTSGYLTKWNGTNTITNGPQLGSSTTTFLRNDGTWATPTNTDTKVTQSQTTTTNYRPILFGAKDSTDISTLANTVTDQAYTSTKMFAKPDTGNLYASGFSTSSYINGTGAQLAQYGLYLRSYKSASLPAGGNYSYAEYAIRVYDGKAADNSGMLLTIDGGGLTIVGGGESAKSLAALISDDQRDSNTSRTRLDVGGTLNTAYHGSEEQLILSSDNNIYFLTTCQTITNRKPVVLDTNSYFYPGTTKTGSIGTSSYMWNSVYAATIYENGTSLASKYAAIGHTHGLVHSNLNQMATNGTTGGWSVIGIDPAVAAFVLKSIRINQTSPNWLCGDYGAGIAFGGADTKGVISMKYQSPVITFAGGSHSSSKTEPTWYFKISGTSGSTYNLANFYDSTISRTANTVLAAPNGSNGAASFRKLVAADIPSLNYSKVSISRNLTSGTKIGTITIDGTSTDLYCQTNTNTDTKVKVTASTSKAYLIGTTTSPDGTAVEGVGNTGVYMTDGVLTASSIHGSGVENQSTAPAGGYRIYDCRSVNVSPNDGDKAANFYFHMTDMPDTSLWWSVLHMRGWTGAFAAWEIAGPSHNTDQRTKPLYVRTSNTNTAWGSWRKIYDASNPPTASEVGALASTTKYAASSSVGGAATSANILNKNNAAGATMTGVQYANGQLTVGTADGNAVEGSNGSYKLWSYPAGGTVVGGGTANIQNLRLYWSSTYFRDIFISPNNYDIYHRSVAAGTAQPWRKILDSGNYTSYALPRNIKHIHTASGKEGSVGWVKIARITVTADYPNHPMTFTIAQRGVMQYRIHLVLKNYHVASAAISQFIIARDNSWTDTNNYPRAYIIKPSDGIFDLYIRKIENYDHIFVVDFTKADGSEGDNYSVTWTNVHAADSEITGGTEAVKKLYLPTSGGTMTGELKQITQLRIYSGNYGTIFRNNGTNTYFLLTESGSAESGSWNSLRPLYFSNSTGKVTIGNGLTVYNGITGDLTGNASTATKLETARNIALAEDFAGSANFDGSGNISISGTFYRCSAFSYNTANYPWHRIAYRSGVTGTFNDTDAIFMIRAFYNGGPFGIIKVTMRTNGPGTNCQVAARWLVRQNIAANVVYIAQWGTSGQSVYADIFLKGGTYNRTYVYQIAGSRLWTLVDSNEEPDTTTSDKKGSTEVYASIAAAGTTLHNQAYTQTVAGIDQGHVNSANSATYATLANYLDVVAGNEVRFYNNNQVKEARHFWLGYSWADGSHYTPSGGSDTSSTTAPNITKFVMGNCSAGGLTSVHAKTFILGNGASPTLSSKTTTITTAATTTDRTITLPDDSGTVALTSKTFNVTRGNSVSTATTGYWSAMCNSTQAGSPTLPTSAKWWHVISMDWTNNDTNNWISQLAIATQDGSGVWWRRNNASGTSIDSSSWHRLAEGNSSGAATNIATEEGKAAGARPVFYAYLDDNTRVVYNTNFTYNPSGNVLKASTFDGEITTLAFHNRIYALSQTPSGSTWNGNETLITSIPSASGTSTPNYQRVKSIDFIKDCISDLKEPVLYENTTNPSTNTTIQLPNGIPKYLKVFIGVEYSSDGSTYSDSSACINCIDVDMAHTRHGGFIGYDTPGQAGVGNYLAYCYVNVKQNTGSTTAYTVGISYAKFLNLATSAVVQNIIARIVKIIAVY